METNVAPRREAPHHPLTGFRLAADTCELPIYVCQLWNHAARAADFGTAEVQVDPMIVHYLVMRAGGGLVGQISTLFGVPVDAGIMVGEIDLLCHADFVAGGEYSVKGKILDVRRRRGTRLPVFDLVSFEHNVALTGSATPTATFGQTWILPVGRDS